jgi:hypothetical protein
MSDIFLESHFGGDSPLNREIEGFTQMLATRKMLRFNLEEESRQIPELTASGLIHKAPYFAPGLDGTFENDPRIMYACVSSPYFRPTEY